MKKTNWAAMGLYENKSISELFKLFMNTILNYFHLSFPLEKKKVHKPKSMDYTGIIKMSSRYEMNYTNRRKDHQHQKPLKKFFKYKNTNLLKQRKAERDYYYEQFEIHKNDLRNSWKILKEMKGKVDQHKVKKPTQHSL